jgi:hypothetical protein
MYRATTSAEQARRRNQALGCGQTVTDWRLYAADHRRIDGEGNQTAE